MPILKKLALLGLLGAAARFARDARRRGGASTPVPAPAAPSRPGPEREEWGDSRRPDAGTAGASDPADTLVAQEESAAAAEAGAIGGTVAPQVSDPAMDPVYQAGGGEQEGFEAAEQDLIEAAQHGDSEGDPGGDAFTGELESDRSTAEYGEADTVESTQRPDADSA